jgi:hypothetical protein
LKELGYSDEQIAEMSKSGVLGKWDNNVVHQEKDRLIELQQKKSMSIMVKTYTDNKGIEIIQLKKRTKKCSSLKLKNPNSLQNGWKALKRREWSEY